MFYKLKYVIEKVPMFHSKIDFIDGLFLRSTNRNIIKLKRMHATRGKNYLRNKNLYSADANNILACTNTKCISQIKQRTFS